VGYRVGIWITVFALVFYILLLIRFLLAQRNASLPTKNDI